MSQTNGNSLSEFMKKKINEKSTKKHFGNHFDSKIKKIVDEDKGDTKEESEEEDEEKKKKAAKEESNRKAADYNKFEMYKKLIIKCIFGYIALLTIVVAFALTCIMLGPAIMKFFQIFINNLTTSILSS